MRRHVGHLALVSGLVAVGAPAAAQTEPQPPLTDPSLGITVTATRLDEARSSIQPSLGATIYDFTPRTIDNIPQGENAPLNQVLLRAPGVVQDSFGQIHVRGDHGNVQYRLDGVQLPEGLSLFNNVLATRYADQMSLLTGALPAQYGLQTAGVVDIALKSGTTNPGAEVSITGGSRNYSQPAFSYGGRTGAIDYFAAGQYIHNGLGIENPTSSFTPIHDDTDQWYGLAKITGIIDEQTRGSAFIAGGASSRFQIPNIPFQAPNFTVNGQTTGTARFSTSASGSRPTSASPRCRRATRTLDFQLSGFARYSSLSYQPDAVRRPAVQRHRAVDQADQLRRRRAGRRLLEGRRQATRCAAASWCSASAPPASPRAIPCRWCRDPDDPTSDLIPSDQPIGFTDGSDLIGWTYSVYLQDEWRVVPTVTVNFGLRFDAINGATQENQLSPRINVVWQPSDDVHRPRRLFALLHAAAAHPGQRQLDRRTLAGTVAAPEVTTNDPGEGRALRLFRRRRHASSRCAA